MSFGEVIGHLKAFARTLEAKEMGQFRLGVKGIKICARRFGPDVNQ